MEIVHKRNGSAYEVAWRGGCATGWGKCPNENPIAAYELDKASTGLPCASTKAGYRENRNTGC